MPQAALVWRCCWAGLVSALWTSQSQVLSSCVWEYTSQSRVTSLKNEPEDSGTPSLTNAYRNDKRLTLVRKDLYQVELEDHFKKWMGMAGQAMLLYYCKIWFSDPDLKPVP